MSPFPATFQPHSNILFMILLTYLHGGALAAPFHHDTPAPSTEPFLAFDGEPGLAHPASASFSTETHANETMVDIEENFPEFSLTHQVSRLQILTESGAHTFFDPLVRFIKSLFHQASDVYNEQGVNYSTARLRKLDVV